MRFGASDAVTHELLALEPEFGDSSNAAAKKKKKKKNKKSVAKTTESGHQEDRLGNEAATNDESEAGAGRDTVTVVGAGTRAANGTYRVSGKWDGVDMYAREVAGARGKAFTFTLFRCELFKGDRRWYISVVPTDLPGIHPGTNQDIDYYFSPSDAQKNVPPRDGWTTCEPLEEYCHPPHLPVPQGPPPHVVADS